MSKEKAWPIEYYVHFLQLKEPSIRRHFPEILPTGAKMEDLTTIVVLPTIHTLRDKVCAQLTTEGLLTQEILNHLSESQRMLRIGHRLNYLDSVFNLHNQLRDLGN